MALRWVAVDRGGQETKKPATAEKSPIGEEEKRNGQQDKNKDACGSASPCCFSAATAAATLRVLL